MKKVLTILFAATVALSITACGSKTESKPETTAAPTKAVTTSVAADATTAAAADMVAGDYTPEQLATAEKFAAMSDRYNALADQVNIDENLNSVNELVDTMNLVADAINEDDALFEDPANLTDEVLKNLEEGIVVGNELIDQLEAMVANYSGKQTITVPVEIINNTGADLHGLAMSPTNDENWGGNLLDEALLDGESGVTEMTFTEDTLVWDLLAADSEGTSLSFIGIDFTEAPTQGAKISLTFENGSYVAAFAE